MKTLAEIEQMRNLLDASAHSVPASDIVAIVLEAQVRILNWALGDSEGTYARLEEMLAGRKSELRHADKRAS